MDNPAWPWHLVAAVVGAVAVGCESYARSRERSGWLWSLVAILVCAAVLWLVWW